MARLITIFATLVFGLSQAAHAQSAADQWLTAEQISSDIDLAREAYSRIHPGYTRYASADEMDTAWSQIVDAAQAKNGMSLGAFYLAVEAALVTIRCDHTKAELPSAIREERAEGAYYLPFRWVLIEGRGFIETAAEGTELTKGDEILSIDGRPLEDVVSAVSGYIPVDGYTEWARRGGISQSLEFQGGAVDHFGALLWSPPPVAKLLIRGADGETREVDVSRIGHAAWTALGDQTGSARNFKDAVTFEEIGENAAYLRIDTFVNYRDPVEPDDIYGPIFQKIRTDDRDTLILDLRSNGGGSTDASQRLVAHLITEKMQTTTEMRVATLDFDGLRENLWTWDARALKPNRLGFRKNKDGTYSMKPFVSDDLKTIQPAKTAFTGRLIILTSSDNSSGSTNVIAVLDGLGRAVTIGERTGGSAEGPTAGLLFTLTLPESGIKTRIPFFLQKNNVPSFETGLGITPDISAPMTVDAFLEGRDPALEAAYALIDEEVAIGALQ